MLVFFGNEDAKKAVEAEKEAKAILEGKVKIYVNQEGRITSVQAVSNNPLVPFDVGNGYYMGLSN